VAHLSGHGARGIGIVRTDARELDVRRVGKLTGEQGPLLELLDPLSDVGMANSRTDATCLSGTAWRRIATRWLFSCACFSLKKRRIRMNSKFARRDKLPGGI